MFKRFLTISCLTVFFSLGSFWLQAEEVSGKVFPFQAMGGELEKVWAAPDAQKIAGADGPIRIRGNDFVNDAGPIRFWGVNTCFNMNFPDKEKAVVYARRMAKFGINAVRLHHMDSRDIWGKNISRTQTEIDPEQLDKLDWLIYQFKQNGIYVNINLHVSRKFNEKDGFVGYDERPKQDKGIDNFEPRMVELQKKYAKDLLTHVNPYTKLAYTEDPCVAMIEINNENSVVASWFWGQLDTLPEVYEAMFQKKWNEWLAKKYDSTEAVRKAWNSANYPLSENLVPCSTFESQEAFGKSDWFLELGAHSKASLQVDEGGKFLRMKVEKMGKNAWNPQMYVRNVKIEKGMPYTVTFRARADQERSLSVGVSQDHAEWQNLGLAARWEVTKEWKTYTYQFIAREDDPNARLAFSNFAPGTFDFDDVSLVAGGTVGLAPDEKLEDQSIGIVYRNKGTIRSTPEAKRDFTFFVLDLEDEYWQEMYRYIKDDLKAKAPVSGTQLQYGAHYAQARLDYCDIHAYWNHPNFPGKPWDQSNWKVGNKPLVNVLGKGGTVASLANLRVLGKPYTVSEYNHPYPNLYGAEGFPMISSMAAFQNWGGIFIFAWSHTKELEDWYTPSFFDICANPIQLVHMPACYNMFVRGDVRSALSVKNVEKRVYELGYEQEREIQAGSPNGYHRSLHSIGLTSSNPLEAYVGVRTKDLPFQDAATQGVPPFVKPENYEAPLKTVSPTGEMKWNVETEKKGFYQVDTPRTKIFTGFIDGRTFSYADGTKIIPGKTILDWATISLTQLDEKRYLLAATGFMQNKDWKLRPYSAEEITGQAKIAHTDDPATLLDKDITYCRARGSAPTLCEGIAAKVILPASGDVKVYPLDGNGKRMEPFSAKRLDGQFVEIEILPKYQTLWYEVVK
ncbi:MAG: carbohydrate binding domain-containing protein [Planctomycetia bacterium]|nr:carbohydrate binding domain-containing protein [Planctomycetia bacterium]